MLMLFNLVVIGNSVRSQLNNYGSGSKFVLLLNLFKTNKMERRDIRHKKLTSLKRIERTKTGWS